MVASSSTHVKEIGDGTGIAKLRAALHGELILPGDAAYEAARRVWNGAIDRHPAVIVRYTDVDDVRRAVEFGRESHLDVAVRGGGHSFPGFSTCDGGLGLFALLDPSVRSGRHYYMKASSVSALSDGAIDALVDSAEGLTSPYSQIALLHVHGAAVRVDATDTAFPLREEHFEIMHLTGCEDNADEKHAQ